MTLGSDRNTKKPQRRGARTKKLLAASATAATVSLALAVPVLAATPPQLPHDITAFPQRDMVVADGYDPNTRLNISVRRAGAVVGRAIGTTDRTGLLEVNHPGGICWGAGAGANLQVTPDIQPEDLVTVAPAGTPSDSSRIMNVQIDKDDPATPEDESGAAFINADGNVEVHGTAQTAAGERVELDQLEQRIIQPEFRDTAGSRIDRRDIRADGAGGRVDGIANAQGNLSYDSATFDPNDPNRFDWTAVYTGLNQTEKDLAVEGQSRIMSWMDATAAGDRLGLTIFEADEVNGPGFGGCPAGPGGPVSPEDPDAPLLYDNDPADDDPANPTFQTYDASQLLDPADPATDLTQLHEVVVFPERDFVSAAGYATGQNLEVVVRRPGTGIIGSARGVAGRDGVFEVNHPGGANWTGQTPNIRPGDIVDLVQFNDPDPATLGDEAVTGGETQRTINVTANAASINAAGNVQINGRAINPDGTRIPLDRLEQRIIQPEFRGTAGSRISRRDIRADNAGGRVEGIANAQGNLTYPNASSNWRAVYTGLNATERGLALEGQTRVLSWLAADADDERFGITIFEVGEAGGPGMGGAPPSGNESLPVVE